MLETAKKTMTKEEDRQRETIGSLELISSVYQNVLQKHPHRELDFEGNPPVSLIAYDSDTRRKKRGVILYDRVSLVTIEKRSWVLALGTRSKGYPANDFSFDLKAFQHNLWGKSEEELIDDIRKKISDSPFFQRSLITGVARGTLINSRYPPSASLKRLLLPEFHKFIAQKPEIDRHFVSGLGVGPPIMRKVIKYKPELAEVIADAVSEVLQG
jgi:hypothetical protein